MAFVLGMVSCQNAPDEMNVSMGGEQEVMLTVSLPEATRANSADGALDNGVLTNYDLRYILEVYYGEKCNRFVQTSTSTSAVFPVRLAPGRDYTFVVWADFVTKGANAENDIDLFYKTSAGLKAIQIIEDKWAPMVEARDAYVGSKTIDNFQTSSNLEMTLTRPFAKVRVVSTDIEQLRGVGIVPTTAQATYSQNMYRKFNAVTGVASDAAPKTHTFAYANVDSYEANTDSKLTIFSDYIFVPKDGAAVAKFTLEVWDGEAEPRSIKLNNFNTDIFVEKNKVTSIVGDVLTTGGNVKVTINGDLGEKETITVVDNAQSLQEIINEAPVGEQTNITLGGDIDLNDLLNAGILSTRASEPAYAALLVDAGKEVVLDLKGFTISYEKTQTANFSMIQNDGKLTIVDSSVAKTGKIVYTDKGQGGKYVSNTLNNSGVLTIESGTIENNSSATVAANGYPHPIDNSGTLDINGGTFTNNAHYSSMRIWCTTDDNTIVTIDGGTFNGSIDFQTPSAAANKGTLTINGGTFNADTYTKTAVRLLGFGADVDEMNGYIKGGVFNGAIALRNWSGSDFNSKVFNITGGTFTTAAKEATDEAFINDDYAWVEEANGFWTVVRKADVAKIGEVGYTSLQKAVKAAQNGDTVLFVADVEQEDGVIITDKNITIDLNNKTFTVSNGASTNNRNFKVNGSSVVTIKNGNMVAAGDYSSGAYGTLRTEGTANVTLERVKLYNYRGNGLNVKALSGTTVTINDTEIYSQYGGGVEAAGGTVELTNVKVEQKGMYTAPYNSMAISVNVGGTVTVNSGTYSTECITAEEASNQGTSHGPWCAGVLNSGGTLIIKDGTFSNDNFGENTLATYARGLLLADTGANIQIQGGTFNAVKAIIDMTNNLGDASRNPSATISGGVFSADPRISGLYASHLISIAAGYKVVEENGIWTVVVDPAAKIGETEYASLQEAFNVGGEITLLRDINIAETVVLAEGKTVVLDLNGKTLAAEDKNTIKNNGGNLTLKNGTVTRTGDGVGYSVNNASGEINVVDATIERGLYTSGSKMTATNANISHEQSSRHAIYAWNCEVTINSGIFHNDNAGNATLMASGSSIVTINGGTFSIADGRSTLGWTSSMIDQNSTAQVIVKGGLFNGGFRINSADTTLTIEGGEFNTNNGSAFTDYSGTKVVKGGKFTDAGAQNWAKKYIAEGYEMNANGEVVVK